MALGSTQPLTEMSTGVFPGGKGRRCVRLTNFPTSCAVVMKSGNLNFLEHSGPLQACNGTAFSLPFTYSIFRKTLSLNLSRGNISRCAFLNESCANITLNQSKNLQAFKSCISFIVSCSK